MNSVYYAIVNTKGGVGKTTNALHLACELARRGPTLLVDGDPQGSCATWAAWRRDASTENRSLPSPTTIVLRGKAVLDEGRAIGANYRHIVVDAGGRDNSSLRNALLLANVAIVPLGASYLDAAAMTDIIELLETARDYNPGLEVKALLTRIDPKTKQDGKEYKALVEFLEEQKFSVLESTVCERIAFRRAVGAGLTVEEVETPDEKAVHEMKMFYKEVIQ